MKVNVAETASFRAKLRDAKFYERWRGEFGNTAWELLEAHSGKLA